MTSKIEGISKETVQAMVDETFNLSMVISEEMHHYEISKAITALLASGEVVLKRDVEELVLYTEMMVRYAKFLDATIATEFSEADLEMHYTHFANKAADLHVSVHPVEQALAKFTTAPLKGDTK